MRRYSYLSAFAALVLALTGLPVLSAALRNISGQDTEKEELPEDKYVRLMSAQSVQIIEKDGKSYRKAEGPARFLHNDTWLICDTALWCVDEQLIYAFGHVSIEQDETELRGDSLTYIVQENLAKFRGHVVQLQDKDGNILRTGNMDYNTKDSVAVFRAGGSMKDNKGQVIESLDGTYESKIKLFTFRDSVEMFTDSVFIKTSLLLYDTRLEQATFPNRLEAWKEDKMLSSQCGWYKRNQENFFFRDSVHTMSEDKEGWCDTLLFDKLHNEVELLGNAQVTDTSRGVTAMGGYIHYTDSLSKLVLMDDPVVIMKVEDDDAYTRADTIYYWTQKKCDVDSLTKVLSKERLAQISVDPVANVRTKAAEELARRVKEAEENDPNRPPPGPLPDRPSGPGMPGPLLDRPSGPDMPASRSEFSDSVALAFRDSLARADSLSRADSIAAALTDTTRIGFLRAVNRVKMFRPKMQAICDSLVYSDLDSIARMFKTPVIWNGTHQYNSDSLFVVISNGRMSKANLLSNAFIQIEEQEYYYDQIRSSEMMAYFDDSTRLARFDAMGSVTALFFFNEKGRISAANRKEASMMSAEFENGEISKISYYETPKSNAYPVAQMSRDDKYLKGFDWKKEQSPKSPSDLTSRIPRKSQRAVYAARPKTVFKQTDKYFPGYFAQVYKDIARADSLRRLRPVHAGSVADSTALSAADTVSSVAAAVTVGATAVVAAIADSLSRMDSLALADSIARADSIAALPKVPDGYVLVHPDDNEHSGTVWLGHVTVLDTAKRAVNLDSLRLELYVDTSGRYHLPDTLPATALLDSSGRLTSLDSAGLTLVIIKLTDREIKKIYARQARAARIKASEERRAAALAEREKKWKELDAKDAAKKAEKEARKQAKERARQEALLRKMAREQAREAVIKESYKAKYLRKMTGR